MAKPIKETPFLTGKDAVKFVEDNKTVDKLSSQEMDDIKESYEALKSISDFESK